MATVYAGTSGRYETVGSTVKIGNFKSKEAEGARIKFHDVNLSTTGKDYLKGGAHKYGELKSATSTYRNGTATGEVVYEAIKKVTQGRRKKTSIWGNPNLIVHRCTIVC